MKKHIFHLAWSPESLPTVDAISPLLGFLDARLQDWNRRLLKGNVLRCLHIMWEAVLHQIDEHVQSNSSVCFDNNGGTEALSLFNVTMPNFTVMSKPCFRHFYDLIATSTRLMKQLFFV